jgi:hypothetical protein
VYPHLNDLADDGILDMIELKKRKIYTTIPCCTFKINSPDDEVGPESGPAVMSRAQMLCPI